MAISETIRQVPEYKKRKVEEIKEIIENYSVIGLANIFRIESNMLQNIRKNLRGKIGLKIIKNNLLKIALEEVDRENISELKKLLEGATALVYTDLNPYKMKKLIEENRSFTLAKAGYISPKDIAIEAGDTGFPPGPIITELNEAGLKTRIKGGTIWVREDTKIVEDGEEITPMQAIVLARLNIRPIELGLDLYAAYDGEIYESEDLKVDIDAILNNLKVGAQQGYSLAINIEFITPNTIIPLIHKAHNQARSLVLKSEIIIKDYIDEIVALANSKAIQLIKEMMNENPDALPKDLVDSIPSITGQPASTSEEASEEKEEKTEESEKDEDSTVGIGNLFG